MNAKLQDQIDSLKRAQIEDESKLRLVNPNYLSDFKGYILGMSLEEIDRLHSFREKGLFIQSLDEFQNVTGASDSLLEAISPNLRFPKAKKFSSGYKSTKRRTIAKKDINIATASDLESIYGIGGVLSNRIIKFRNALGGFITVDQLYDVYGLEEEVVKNVVERYKIVDIPEIERISINESTVPELASLVYLSWDVAREIVAYRNSIGAYSQWEDLAQVSGFPFDKIERIKLYLTL